MEWRFTIDDTRTKLAY